MSKFPTSGVIVLRSVNGKHQGAFWPCPVRDEATGKLLGVKPLSETQKLATVKVVTEQTQRKITDGAKFDLDGSEIDQIDWLWLIHNVEIQHNAAACKEEPRALFFIEEPDREAKDKVAKSKLMTKALSAIADMTLDEQRKLTRYMGMPAETMRPLDIEEYLFDRATHAPDKILSAMQDKSFKERLFLFDLVDKRIVKKDGNGTYKFGDIILGLNIPNAIQYLQDPKNRDLTARMFKLAYHKDLPAEGSIVEELEKENTGEEITE